ncbi:Acetoin utilization deacetylase AcuC [Prosthecobacter debontii]|uniref:Acetoin utilization deacetylase AcuC n=1 Tax=Prosthecobacter debontii TaxID=48467 RepID=A0A1T4WQN2_9BACT|nr:histone deacetylase [Prosthecobacter debontii]SKA79664.1 Acetoin utilization deacetylase AcuC [Prosthecobacter debontii]
MTTGLHLASLYTDHETGPGHPESPSRYTAITRALTESGLLKELTLIEKRIAEEAEIELCHTRDYIDLAREEITAGLETLSTGDTQVCEKSYDIATHAVGAVLNAVDAVMQGKLKRAFCAVRPPGHHARPAQGMGFCVFNNIAVGARYAQRKHGAAKVVIVDWDVHHGNGTQDIFDEDGSVLFASTHQSPWYPFTGHAEETGSGKGKGTTMNFPFAAGAGMKEFSAAFDEKLLPGIARFKPDLIMISAGFDSRMDDPLGRFKLTDDDFAALTRLLMQAADEHCQGRLVSVLEGGYNLSGLASAVTAHVEALAE